MRGGAVTILAGQVRLDQKASLDILQITLAQDAHRRRERRQPQVPRDRARALYERVATSNEYEGTQAKRDAELKIAEVEADRENAIRRRAEMAEAIAARHRICVASSVAR